MKRFIILQQKNVYFLFLQAASRLGAHKVFFSIYGKDLDQIYGDFSWEVMVPCLIIVINLPYKSYSVNGTISVQRLA